MKRLLVFLLLITFVINVDLNEGLKPGPDKKETKPISAKCKGGKFENGKCICNPGFRLKGQFECVKDNKCIGGRNVNGVCKCPNGQLPKNGICQSRKDRCPPKQILFKGRCIPLIHRPCPYEPPRLCPNGKRAAPMVKCHLKDDLSRGDCPVGKKKVGNICMPILKRPQGNTRNN